MRLPRPTVAMRGLPALLALGALLLLSIAPASAAVRPLVTGVTNIGDDDPLAFEHTRATGAQFVRIPLNWGEVAPAHIPPGWHPDDPADPSYDWGADDTAVVNAVQAGLTPVLQVDGAPSWGEGCQSPSFARAKTCDPDPAALAAFATAAARRYSGDFAGLPTVRYWQVLNEPNLSLFFNPQFEGDTPVSPGLYRTLINSFYAAVKAVDPSNLVLAAGLGPVAVPRYTIGPMRFARLLLCMEGHNHPRPTSGDCGGGVHFDIFAIQPYTTGGPTHEGGVNDVELGDLPKLQELLRAADRAGRIKGDSKHTPLWITEFSWDSKPPDPGGLPMGIETRWTAEALHNAWRAGVDHFFWYSLHDDPYDPSQPFSETLQSGLYFRGATLAEDQPKEVLYAFRFPFVAYPGDRGLSFWGRTPSGTGGKVTIQLWKGGHWEQADTENASAAGIFRGLIKRHYGRNRRGLARTIYGGQASPPFAMKPVPDFIHPPFG
jgi:hypothetical protein